MKDIISKLAVCSWSLQPTNPESLFEQLDAIGINRLQIALDPIRNAGSVWGKIAEQCAARGVTLVSGMFGTVGEDYTTMESIQRTGGVVPDATWEENWEDIRINADLAERMGLKIVTFHAGFLPHEARDPNFTKLLDRIGQIAELFAKRGIMLGFETGQETAATLAEFLKHLNCPNVGVNFDPANLILYEKGDPIEALRTLCPWLKQVHVKDARRTTQSGTWGKEVVVGTGDVDWRAFFTTLGSLGFQGWCCIEREAGSQRVADIRAARQFLETL